MVIETKRRTMKVMPVNRDGDRRWRNRARSLSEERDLKLSTFAGTRKIASFSWAEGSQGKPWWTFECSADVQIACQIWVKGRKTHRAI